MRKTLLFLAAVLFGGFVAGRVNGQVLPPLCTCVSIPQANPWPLAPLLNVTGGATATPVCIVGPVGTLGWTGCTTSGTIVHTRAASPQAGMAWSSSAPTFSPYFSGSFPGSNWFICGPAGGNQQTSCHVNIIYGMSRLSHGAYAVYNCEAQ